MSEVYKVIMKCDEWQDGSEKFDLEEKVTRSQDKNMDFLIGGGVVLLIAGVGGIAIWFSNRR